MKAARHPGWWYPYIFVAVFVLVVAVNAVMIWFAGSTFPGLTAERAYDRGLAYNQALEAARRQEALGWAVETVAEPSADGATTLIAQTYRDRAGDPVEGLRVRVRLSRPADSGHDRVLDLTRSGPGVYAGTVSLSLSGIWDLQAVAEGGGGGYQSYLRFAVP